MAQNIYSHSRKDGRERRRERLDKSKTETQQGRLQTIVASCLISRAPASRGLSYLLPVTYMSL